MAVVTTTAEDNDMSDRQAGALITLLETFQPRSALKPYLVTLKAIVKDLELVDELPDGVPTCPTSTSTESGKSQADESEETTKPTIETETGIEIANVIDDLEEENDDEVTGLMNKLKGSLSFSPQNSVGSTTVLNNDDVNYDASMDTKSFATKSFAGGSMRIRTFNMAKISLTKRPSNDEQISPTNKPPTPMKSSSWRSPTHQQQQQQQQPESQAMVQSPTQRCDDRHLDSSRFIEDTVQEKVFGTSSVLARILEFDGSLAAYYKNYDLIEGYKVAYRRRRAQIRFKQRMGTNQLAFVNRKFHSLIIGPEGLEEWKTLARQEILSCKRIANSITHSKTETPSPLAKIFAIVIRNDAIEFEYLLKKHITSVQEGTTINVENGSDIFGMALKEYVDGESVEGGGKNFELNKAQGDSRQMGLPQGHPFLKYIKCWQAREFYYTTLLAELTFNAIVYGAHDVLSVLSSKHSTLFSIAFGSKGAKTLLGTVFTHVCSQPICLEEISQGIRILMSKQRYGQEELHAPQKGSHGNSLHVAAAKGDCNLVNALLDIGFDPTRRCDERALSNERGEINEKLWYPHDWARVRGHEAVVKLLSQRRKQIKQQRQQIRRVLSETTNEGTAEDYQTVDYETITANDTLTADYGSSSCSSYGTSQYDSEDDTFEEGPTFEDNTYGDESSEYDSDDNYLSSVGQTR